MKTLIATIVLIATPAMAADCFIPVAKKTFAVQQYVEVPQFAIGYQYHATPLYVSVGSHYRASRAESVDESDVALLKRFRAYLEAERAIEESKAETVIGSSCVQCHRVGKSGGGYVFDGSAELDAGTKSAMMRQVLSGSMPPDRQLTAEEMATLADELFLERW